MHLVLPCGCRYRFVLLSHICTALLLSSRLCPIVQPPFRYILDVSVLRSDLFGPCLTFFNSDLFHPIFPFYPHFNPISFVTSLLHHHSHRLRPSTPHRHNPVAFIPPYRLLAYIMQINTFPGNGPYTVPASPFSNTHSGNPPNPPSYLSSSTNTSAGVSPNMAAVDGKEQRLIVVSNRLPVTISKDANGEYHFKVSRSTL